MSEHIATIDRKLPTESDDIAAGLSVIKNVLVLKRDTEKQINWLMSLGRY